jgi:hypothetical protein
VHGLDDPKAKTWTRKLKEYVELMCPGQSFPYHFQRRDERGDMQLGRRFGVDGTTQILKVGQSGTTGGNTCCILCV